MRIISGQFKGRPIRPPKVFDARPTTDNAKESLFNILQNDYYFDELKVLDLFSGTGSISYEFLSRGSISITSVEKKGKYVDFIRQTVQKLEPESTRFFSIKYDAFKFLQKNNLDFDIIFADPPYSLDKIEEIPDLVFQNSTIKENCLLIIEHSDLQDFGKHQNFINLRKYGKVHFSFFKSKKK